MNQKEKKAWEYTIPNGYEAIIEDGKVIIRTKESEDERIRKLLVRFVKYDMPDNYSDDFSKEDCLAWLEKQKDHEAELEKAYKTADEVQYRRGYEDAMKQKPVEYSSLQEAFNNSKKDYTLEEKTKASEYSESILPTSVTYGESDEQHKLHTIVEAAFIAGQKSFKPAEWSEEDESFMQRVIGWAGSCSDKYKIIYPDGAAKLQNWLKSLRPQPKQDLKPRYIEGKGIYVPVIDVVLNMQDEPEKMTWDEAKDESLNKKQWLIVAYYLDEINALLRDNGGKEMKGTYWTSTQYSQSYAFYARTTSDHVISGSYNKCGTFTVRAVSAYPKS